MNDEERAKDTRELMIRLDERLKSVQGQLTLIQASITNKVENDKAYQEMVTKVNMMWDSRSKALGYLAAWSFLITLLTMILLPFLKTIFTGK